MTEPNFSINFTALMAATTGCSAGQALLFNPSAGYWVVANSANRASTGKRSEAVALTAYGGSVVGSVSYQSSGILAQSISGLSSGFSGKRLVRVASDGTLERIATGSVNTSTDDVIGYAEEDGRVHLFPGLPLAEIVTLASGGGSGAPTDASYITLGTNATLTNERVLAAGANISITDGGAGGNATIALSGTVPISNGGTGLSALGSALRVLRVNSGGSAAEWGAVDLTSTNATVGALRIDRGGTGLSALGSGLQVLRTNAGATAMEWATVSAFTPPTGTGLVTVTSSALDAAASTNQRVASGFLQSDNGYQWKNGANLGTLTWSPTASRSIALPDASDTVAVLAASQTLTNKTINATNNTITDTSAATGDLFRHNGTRFVRFGRGTANQILRTNAAGTDIEWSTHIGPSGTAPSVGFIRYPYSASSQRIIQGFWSAGNEMAILDVAGSTVTFGDSVNSSSVVDGFSTAIYGRSGGLVFGSGASATTTLRADGTTLRTALPIAGSSTDSLPFRFKRATITQSSGADTTLTAAQYECPFLDINGTPGVNFNIIAPNNEGATANYMNNTAYTATIKKSGGSGYALASSTPKWVHHDGTDYEVRG